MLIILLVIKIPAILLHDIDTKLRRIHLLCSEIVVLKLSINGSLFLSVGVLNPNAAGFY
jgi:hypothetical protein